MSDLIVKVKCAPGQPHCTAESCNAESRCFNTRHAERSALDYSVGEVATAYVTHEPCLRCTQDLIARGCRAVYYVRGYEIIDLREAAARAWHVYSNGVSWRQLKDAVAPHFVDATLHWSSSDGVIMNLADDFEVVDEVVRLPHGDVVVSRPRYDDGRDLVAVCDFETCAGTYGSHHHEYLPAALGRALIRAKEKK